MTKIFTVGVFDFFHLGHLRLFKRAKKQGDYLIVAIQRNVNKYKPNTKVLYSFKQRLEMVSSIKFVDEVIAYNDVDKIIKKIDFNVFVKGPDQNHNGFKKAVKYCKLNNKKVVTLSRTMGISSTKLKALIESES